MIMDYSFNSGTRILGLLCFFFLTVTEVTSRSLTECFYEIGTVRGVTYLGSIFCQYGCCGTSQDQRCCTRKEKYPDEDEGRTWRIVALAFAGVIIVLALSLVACWVLKKKNRKNVRVRSTNCPATGTPSQRRYTNQADIFAIDFREPARQPQPPAYSYLPKYPDTVHERGNQLPPITGYTRGNQFGNADGNQADLIGGNMVAGTLSRPANITQGDPVLHIAPQRPASPPPSYAP